MAYQRQTAVHCSVKDLREGAWLDGKPSGVATPRGFVGRANLMGLCVGNDEGSVILDDGTGVIRASKGERSVARAKIGSPALIIGVPHEYEGERYLTLEIAAPVTKDWLTYRKKELSASDITPLPKEEERSSEGPKNPLLQLIDLIREMDDGSGVQIDDVIAKRSDAEGHIRTLLEEGEIFEVRPGRVKVLD